MDRTPTDVWADFSTLNTAYLAELYERYQADPASVDAGARAFFEQWGPPREASYPVSPPPCPPGVECDPRRAAAAIALSTAIRMYGYRAAKLDPLGSAPRSDIALFAETHGIKEDDLAGMPATLVGGPLAPRVRDALAAVRALREIYEGTSGYEFEHVSNSEERLWLREAVESGRHRPPLEPLDDVQILRTLTRVEAFERFLQTAFPTQTRFSVEGLDIIVPMLEELIAVASEAGAKQMILGMAHRGRLNIMAHVLGKPYEKVIAEFQGALEQPDQATPDGKNLGWTGDVKYHLGARKAFQAGQQQGLFVTLLPNPSHLEFIDPVVEGVARAAGERRDSGGPARLEIGAARPVLLHGEAAFVGEGVVAETLNLSSLPGYRSGGTFHILANNQVGFTTPPELGRSTLFASDLAKGFEIPIVHVNADDPIAAIAAIRLGHQYVVRFRKDVVIDVIGYRRRGHNEGDEPSFSQPRMYQLIASHPPVRQLWAAELARRGVVSNDQAVKILAEATDELRSVHRRAVTHRKEGALEANPAGLDAGGTFGGLGHAGAAADVVTGVHAATLSKLNEELLALPDGFQLHPKLAPLYARRKAVFATDAAETAGRVDWAHAEALAFASILAGAIPIRLTGQDVARGTFSQRHIVLHDAAGANSYIPLRNIPSARAAFDVWDSPLSEQAALGFEFGYNIQDNRRLVLWEAQYGDFANAAQTVVDEFVTAARSKWGQRLSLVILLPHGYEGQGPDHSSARPERYLQLAAEDNLRLAFPTTAAQYFHLLRRQAALLSLDPRPLVVLTPKSLLRHPLAASSIEELAAGRFQPAIDDHQAASTAGTIKRLILCSGKVYFDLVTRRDKMPAQQRIPTAIVRVEELYPFPATMIQQTVAAYPSLQEVVWVQEEPRNMGFWTFVAPRLRDLLGDHLPLRYVGRTRRASPAEAAFEWHAREQARLVEAALPGVRAFGQPES